jgi:hypothetical protein
METQLARRLEPRPYLAKIVPDWRHLRRLFDCELFERYASSLVRATFFKELCEEDHPVLIQERSFLNGLRDRLVRHVHDDVGTVRTGPPAAATYLRHLVAVAVSQYGDVDDDLRERVAAKLRQSDPAAFLSA